MPKYFTTIPVHCNLRRTREIKPVTKQADIFSYAIVLWELCALKKPFAGMNAQQHSRKVVSFILSLFDTSSQ